jgi:membrane associated rhomboid family serine protease
MKLKIKPLRPNSMEVQKVILALLLCGWYVSMPQVGYVYLGHDTGTLPHIILTHAEAMLSHANIWHLLGNLFVLMLVRKLNIIPSVVIAYLASFIPTVGTLWDIIGRLTSQEPVMTMGFSGVLFAMLGVIWGDHVRIWSNTARYYGYDAMEAFLMKMLPWALVGFFVPHANWELHLYSLIGGFTYGFFKDSLWWMQRQKT